MTVLRLSKQTYIREKIKYFSYPDKHKKENPSLTHFLLHKHPGVTMENMTETLIKRPSSITTRPRRRTHSTSELIINSWYIRKSLWHRRRYLSEGALPWWRACAGAQDKGSLGGAGRRRHRRHPRRRPRAGAGGAAGGGAGETASTVPRHSPGVPPSARAAPPPMRRGTCRGCYKLHATSMVPFTKFI